MSGSFKYGIGVVLFNPDTDKLFEIYSQHFLERCTVVFIDNHSDNIVDIKKIICNLKNKNIYLIENNENKGIATALNQIMHFYKKREFEWALLLDQDTVVDQKLLNIYEQRISNGVDKKVAIISPQIFDRNIGEIIFKEENNSNVKRCITSGSLNRIASWELVGGFDEFFFIDWVDYDFCTRLIILGNTIQVDDSAILNHSIGDAEKHGRHKIMKHNAFRTYYICRNVYLYAYKFRNYGRETKIITRFDARLKVLKLFVAIILYDDNKLSKLLSGIKGIADYYKCRKRYLEKLL